MSFMYPRVIAVTRPQQASTPGYTDDYGGLDPSKETPVLSGVPANIQLDRQGQDNRTKLPADGKATLWRVFFKGANGVLQNHDVITDDLGARYQVLAPYWNSMGYNALVERLET